MCPVPLFFFLVGFFISCGPVAGFFGFFLGFSGLFSGVFGLFLNFFPHSPSPFAPWARLTINRVFSGSLSQFVPLPRLITERERRDAYARQIPPSRQEVLPACLAARLVLGFAAGVLVTWALFPRATAAQVIPTGGPAASPRPDSAATAAPAPTASPEPAKAASEHPWYLTLVNFETPIDPELEVPLSTLEGSTQRFDSRAISALEDMLAAMEAEGLSPAVCSGYRTRRPRRHSTPGRWTSG